MFDEIISSLAKSDILLRDIEKFNSGLNSTVYTAKSENEKLIIHIMNCTVEHNYQDMDKKMLLVYRELEKHPHIPTAPIISSGLLKDGSVFFVNKYLEGYPFGKREIIGGKIIDTYLVDNSCVILMQLAKILADQHFASYDGFGYIDTTKNHFSGRYKTWMEFLFTESNRWLDNLSGHITIEEQDAYRLAIIDMIEKNRGLLADAKPSLIHWDMNNPSNVLVDKGKISGIIDYEWSIIGDPIWDLVYSEELIQKEYSRITKIPIEDIKKKLLIYHSLWFLWGTNTHFPRPQILKICLNEFITGLEKLKEAQLL